jgi:serine protease Do
MALAGRRPHPAIARPRSPVHLLLAALLLGCGLAASAAEEDMGQLEQRAFRLAVDRVAPSVVRIETVGGLEQVEGVLFGTGPTTGLIVDSKGYVISSAFNFQNRPSSILVRLADGTRKPARLVATDLNRMLVLLKIDVAGPLPVAEIVPEKEMRVGQWAIAVGRAFEGDRPNMSVGILSALGRIWGKAVQTDAAVSPNNYGGPLVDVRGRVLGVLVPLSPQSDSELSGIEWYDSGIGFAVPAQHIQSVLAKLESGKDLQPGHLGIRFTSPNLHIEPPLLAGCHPRSPAARAGLKGGDQIVEIEGRPIDRAAQVKEEISRRYAGDSMRLVVLRGSERLERKIELVATLPPYEAPLLGILPMRAANAADKPDESGDAKDEVPAAGIAVRYVYPGSAAEKAGMRGGDMLVSLNAQPVHDRAEALAQMLELQAGDEVSLEVRRDGKTLKMKARLGQLPDALPPAELPPAHLAVAPSGVKRPPVGLIPLKIPESTTSWAYVPEGYDPAVAHGVVVWLHGRGGFEPKRLAAQWKDLCQRFDLILLAPKAADPARWQPLESALIAKLLAQVQSKYTVDASRIVVHGYESGGELAYLVGFRDRETIAAVAAVEAAPPRMLLGAGVAENDAEHRLAFYVAEADKSAASASTRAAIDKLRKLQYPVTVKGLGAAPRYLDAAELGEWVRWIDMLDRI